MSAMICTLRDTASSAPRWIRPRQAAGRTNCGGVVRGGLRGLGWLGCRTDLYRGLSRRDLRRSGLRLLPACQRLLENWRQLVGTRILQMENEQPLAVGVAAAVEALDPLSRPVDRGLLRGDHEQRVESLDRNHPVQPGQWTQVLGSEHGFEFLDHIFHVHALELEETDRHACHPVDVEHLDGFQQVPQLALGPGENHQIAQFIAPDRRRILGKGLENAQHLLDADELERHHDHAVAWRHCSGPADQLRRNRPADGLCGRDDLVNSRLLDQG
ncbi:MAG: hypothetical protein IPM02_24830 [Betaproteobacteria bacterium]|nr:hypothetical protein [Betaproteobacteria bacterium]